MVGRDATFSDAKKALVSLGFGARDAERAAAAAGPCETAEILVKEALRLMPGRGEVAVPRGLEARDAEVRASARG